MIADAYRSLVAAAALSVPLVAAADAAPAATPAAPLFAEDSALAIEFELDVDGLCRNPEKHRCADLPGTIYYTGGDGERVRLDVKLRTRGRWRHDLAGCAFPALFVYFDPEQTEGTLFESQTMLPFTSHCQHYKKRYHAYTVLEYLVHRLYNVVTESSLRVRLVDVQYRSTGGSRKYRRYGFFVEHFRSAAARIGAEYLDVDRIDPRETDAIELATLSLFQYMVGNLDWSAVEPHNIALFRRHDGVVVAMPYDFDYTGVVDAEYAAPPSFMGQRSVRQRKYRGFCRPGIDWDTLFARFLAIRPEVMRLVKELDGLSSGRRSNTVYYLERFYKIIESNRERRRRIVEDCRPMPSPMTE